MENKKYTLEYYLEQDRLKKQKAREYYLKRKPEAKQRNTYNKRYLSSELYDQIVELAQSGKTNKEICTQLDIPLSSLIVWKRKMRNNGVELPINKSKGRPKINVKLCPHCQKPI